MRTIESLRVLTVSLGICTCYFMYTLSIYTSHLRLTDRIGVLDLRQYEWSSDVDMSSFCLCERGRVAVGRPSQPSED